MILDACEIKETFCDTLCQLGDPFSSFMELGPGFGKPGPGLDRGVVLGLHRDSGILLDIQINPYPWIFPPPCFGAIWA